MHHTYIIKFKGEDLYIFCDKKNNYLHLQTLNSYYDGGGGFGGGGVSLIPVMNFRCASHYLSLHILLFKEVSYAHQGCIYLIKNTIKIVINSKNKFNLK